MDKVVDRRATPAIDQLAKECIEGPFDIKTRQCTEQPLEQYFLTTKHPSDVEPWHTLLGKNSPGTLPAEIPVFLAQGADDDIIRPKVTQAYAARCAAPAAKCASFRCRASATAGQPRPAPRLCSIG
jgi:hypothetical protein